MLEPGRNKCPECGVDTRELKAKLDRAKEWIQENDGVILRDGTCLEAPEEFLKEKE